ncbi:MAG: response regulator [Candidatus Sumerlaeia bacterium]|nr:response regulator [Candidatus Sumerlaeia bacterium]
MTDSRDSPFQRLATSAHDREQLYLRALAQAGIVAYKRVISRSGYDYIGEGITQLTGVPVEELTDEIWRSLLVEVYPRVEAPDMSIDYLRQEVIAGRIRQWRADYKILARDGTIRWLADASVELYEDGAHVGSLGILQDITERKVAEEERLKLEERLLQAQQLESLGALAGGIAHDFNNILGGILGNAELARMELPADSPVCEALRGIEAAAERAAELTGQMLAYAGKARPVRRATDLSTIAREAVRFAEAGLPPNAPIALLTAVGLPLVSADPAQIRQIVLNLLLNAADAIGASSDGLITVETSLVRHAQGPIECVLPVESLPAGDYVALGVRDTGSGIDLPRLDRLFDPFYTTKPHHRGLGLAAVWGLVRAHDGGIRIETRPGDGSFFQILLPVGAPNVQSAQDFGPLSGADSSAPAPPPRPTGLVLVADDDEIVRRLTVQVLTRAGYRTCEAHDGRHAIEVFEERSDEIVAAVLDLTMPVLDGRKVLAHIRQHSPHLPVVLVSGYHESDVTACLEDPLVAFLKKPFRPAALEEALDDVLHRCA